MKSKSILILLTITAIFLLSTAIICVNASDITRIITHTQFNTAIDTDAYDYPHCVVGIEVNDSLSYTISITHDLIFNSTGATVIGGVVFIDTNETTLLVTDTALRIHFNKDNLVFLSYGNGTAQAYLASSSSGIAYTLPITINVTNGTIVTITDANIITANCTMPTILHSNFVLYKSKQDTNTTGANPILSGSMTIDFTLPTTPEDTTDIIAAWIPSIISLAMLSMVIGMLDKFARKK